MNIPKIAGTKGLKFSFLSDSTCFLKIDMQSTNKLKSNTCPGALFEPGDRLNDIFVFHDGSSQACIQIMLNSNEPALDK